MKRLLIAMLMLVTFSIYAQNPCQDGTIIIDGVATDAVLLENSNSTGLTLPVWLEEGKTLAAGLRVHIISVLEFNLINQSGSISLGFNQVISVGTQAQTVPAGKIWKIEAIIKYANAFVSGFSASSNSPICAGAQLNLTASSVAGATYSWTGPNGFTSSLQNPVITNVNLAASGTYTMTATLNGCTSSPVTTDVVVNALPASTFTFSPILAVSNTNITFSPDLSGATYSWTFDSGTTASSTSENPVVQWSNAGNYDVTLDITDNNACSSSTTAPVVVTDCPPGQPSSAFTWSPLLPLPGETVTFTPTTSGSTYDWTFNGGSIGSSTIENPSLSWTAPGNHDVTLTVISAGCFTTTTQSIKIATQTVFNYTGSSQSFIVPAGVTTMTIEAIGAQGGNTTAGNGGTGGLGASMKGTFSVTPGSTLTIGVGGQPSVHGTSGGGGGSSGVKNGTTVLIVGGGGGGGGYSSNSNSFSNTSNAVTTTSGQNVYGCTGSTLVSSGGTGGSGGGAGTNPCSDWPRANGGAGVNGNGGTGDSGSGGSSSGAGGSAGPYGSAGGYGLTGGGAGSYGGGGGGGYSGGGGGASANQYTVGGGGGSYNSGTNQTNTAGVGSGNGKVTLLY